MVPIHPRTQSGPIRPGPALLQIAGFAATSYWLAFAVRWTPGYSQSRLSTIAPLPPVAGVLDALSAFFRHAFVPGLIEELVFRGALFTVLLKAKGLHFAVVVSALLFGAVHPGAHHAGVAALLGLQLGLMRAIHGLPLTIVAHIVNNTLALTTGWLLVNHSLPIPAHGSAPATAGEGLLLIGAMVVSGISCASLVQDSRSRFPADSTSRSTL